MSGFSAEWLALREPADHAARDGGLASQVADFLADRPVLRVLDLGCGTGSNLRALAPLLGSEQAWRLVDHDPRLLDAAMAALSAWADSAEPLAGGLLLRKAGIRITVSFEAADLAPGLGTLLDPGVGLVTAAALFDLVSEAWIGDFAATLAQRELPLYAVLTYDGEDRFEPALADDDLVLAAFHRHQARDKGFGPAAGRQAAGALERFLAARGYAVAKAGSPWRLGPADRALLSALVAGIAEAAREDGVAAGTAEAWATRRAASARAVIGHVDLFARPGGARQSRGTIL